jgi:hypothetical protein
MFTKDIFFLFSENFTRLSSLVEKWAWQIFVTWREEKKEKTILIGLFFLCPSKYNPYFYDVHPK